MRRKKIKLRYKKERVVFSDVLPYELPFIFTNRYFYRFLVKNEISIDNSDVLHWKEGIHKGALAILALLAKTKGAQLIGNTEYDLKSERRLVTIPFNYAIKHKETSNRRLSIVHPLNQIQMVNFYDRYKNTLLYMCGKSHFSIRYPNKVACYFYYKDRLHSALLGKKSDKLEIYFSEYENMKTFFSYKQYANIYKFYEDYRYQRAEKKYQHLLKFDIQGCFDNIYTHSIAWAMNGGMNTYKDHFEGDDDSFASKWRDFMVENHYDFINTHRHKSHEGLELLFKKLGEDDTYHIDLIGEKVYLPSPNLHALFLMRHMLNHFVSIGISIRQILDWAFFVERHTKEIDWNWLVGVVEKYHMLDFFNCINAICVEDLGFTPSFFPTAQFLPNMKDKVLNDIIDPEFPAEKPYGGIKQLLYKYRRWKGNIWKQELCYNESKWSSFCSGVLNLILKPSTK